MGMNLGRKNAFTLIELLVVIAIIAVLVSLLLPSLKGARNASRLAVGLSNMRQINAASTVYRAQYKGYMPIVATWINRNYAPLDPMSPWSGLEGYNTWTYGGKNCNSIWATLAPWADTPAADRPLNSFLDGGDRNWDTPARPARLPVNSPSRNIEVYAFRDPADAVSYQRGWDPSVTPTPTPVIGVSSYDDVGTSYHQSMHWMYSGGIPTSVQAWYTKFNRGTRRIMASESFTPSRFVWIQDQFADVVVNVANPRFQLKNGYGDINKSLMGFMDGSARYTTTYPGRTPQSYNNSEYQMDFDALR
jgi:prepilin-type N-terminal cleavage/methylation domain-containing protein